LILNPPVSGCPRRQNAAFDETLAGDLEVAIVDVVVRDVRPFDRGGGAAEAVGCPKSTGLRVGDRRKAKR
jgi:hypothetical protein